MRKREKGDRQTERVFQKIEYNAFFFKFLKGRGVYEKNTITFLWGR